MGIRGLTGFIDRNPHLLHAYELRDCSVIIDGNNLYHFLYYGRPVRCAFGGDYDVYRKRIIQTFESFEECGIIPYIIFDGAYTRDGKKLKTSLSRAKGRIRLVDCVTNTERGQVLPPLAYETFIQTLNELGISHVTCQFEADSEIAVLANKMNCPVISNDSDFYIFDVPAGFLPLDYVDFNVLTKFDENSSPSYKFLSVRKYHIDEFVDSFDGLSRSILPLFASMLGNDYINASAFQSFYSKFKVPKIVSKKFHLPDKMHKVINVLHWLHSSQGNLSDSMEKILEFVNEKQRPKVKLMLTTSVEGYFNVHTFEGFDLQSYFETNPEIVKTSDVSVDFEHYGGSSFPHWFLEAGKSGNLSTFIVNAAVLHQVIILCQMEDLSQESSYVCSSDIRQIFYGILLKDDIAYYYSKHPEVKCSEVSEERLAQSEESLSQSTMKCDSLSAESNLNDNKIIPKSKSEIENISKCTSVEEYQRWNKGIKKSLISPMSEIDSLTLPGLIELSTMTTEARTSILWACLQIDSEWISTFSEDMKLFIACLVFWSRKTCTKLSTHHLDAILVCAVVLHSQHEQERRLNRERNEIEDERDGFDESVIDLVNSCKKCSSDCLESLQQAFKKYTQYPVFNRRNVYEPQITHAFAQLQACVVDTLNLNKILRQPTENVKPCHLINGTFLYNMYRDLESRPRPDLFLASFFDRSPLHEVYINMRSKIISLIGNECFHTVSSNRKRRKRKPKTGKKLLNGEEEMDNDKQSDSDDNDLCSITGFDIANKFSLLSTIE